MSLKSVYDRIDKGSPNDTIMVYDKMGNFKRYACVNILSYATNDGSIVQYAEGSPCLKDGKRIYRSHYTKVECGFFDTDTWLPNSKFKTHKWVTNTKRFVPVGCSEYTENKNAFILVKISML